MQQGSIPQPPQPPFGVVIAGRPVFTDFRQTSATQCVAEIYDPCSVTDITFFLLNPNAIAPNHGAVLYASVAPFQNWLLVGAIFLEKPSGIFRTSWSTNPEFQGQPVIQLGISIESIESIKNLGVDSSGLEERKSFAYKIALDLFRYMSSFSNGESQGMMMVPSNLLNKWMERFEAKYRCDPNFMMKEN